MRIYTRSGDQGTTSLVYGRRIAKDHLLVEAYGTCDEANSMIGHALSFLLDIKWDTKEEFLNIMYHVQTVLFHVGSEISTPQDREVAWKLKEDHIKELEEQIDEWSRQLPVLKQFILPSGPPAASALHVARTFVRRAERMAVSVQKEIGNPLVVSYLNRLSDFLFVAARYINMKLDGKEIPLQVDE